jgi:signal transduction histidine kinase
LLKKAPIPFAPLDVNDKISDLLSLLRVDSLLQGLSITTHFSQGLPLITGDPVQIQQVILNLILNGATAMKNIPPAQRRLMIKTELQEERNVKVSVTDFGTGIEEHHVQRLFEPFYTTKPGGLGMGLSISQTIIRAHGGTMEVSNNQGGGATFAFTLPAHQGDPS